MKFLFIFALLFCSLVGCSSSKPEEATVKIMMSYKQAQYELEPTSISISSRQKIADEINEKVKSYLTADTLQLFVKNRDAYPAFHAAEKQYTILVDNIK